MKTIKLEINEKEYREIIDTQDIMAEFKKLTGELAYAKKEMDAKAEEYRSFTKRRGELNEITNKERIVIELNRDLACIRDCLVDRNKKLSELSEDFKDRNLQLMRTIKERDELRNALMVECKQRITLVGSILK